MRDGKACSILVVAGNDVVVDIILGLPFPLKMICCIGFIDNVLDCNVLDLQLFCLEFCHTSNHIPAGNKLTQVNATVVGNCAKTIWELNFLEQFFRNKIHSLSVPVSAHVHIGSKLVKREDYSLKSPCGGKLDGGDLSVGYSMDSQW